MEMMASRFIVHSEGLNLPEQSEPSELNDPNDPNDPKVQ